MFSALNRLQIGSSGLGCGVSLGKMRAGKNKYWKIIMRWTSILSGWGERIETFLVAS